MCLILLAHQVDPERPLVLAANRDEFYDRPTAPMRGWYEPLGVFAGRDLKAGGTWLGATKTGRWAAVTNVREPERGIEGARSRGELVVDYLGSDAEPARFLATLVVRSTRYNGFNLLVGTSDEIWFLSNRGIATAPMEVPPGIHGLSNASLNTPWPKVVEGRLTLHKVLDRGFGPRRNDEGLWWLPSIDDDLFEVLVNRTIYPDDELPVTGVGLERERALSPFFITTRGYGTRCSSVLVRDRDGGGHFTERTFANRMPPSLADPPEVVDRQWVSWQEPKPSPLREI